MVDPNHAPTPLPSQPPPAPPLPPGRAGGVFQKFIAPLSFNIGARPYGSQPTESASASPRGTSTRGMCRQGQSLTTTHRTGIPIAAIDTNKARTHAILAGQEILKTVHIHEGRVVEDFNLRSAINAYASAHGGRSETAHLRREYFPARDVCWSHGDRYNTIIATAALNGRIALYDVSRISSSRVELAWIHEHAGQVNKLDFDPTGGYLLLSGSQDKTVRIWDIREPQSVKRKQTILARHPVREVRWSPTDVGEFALCTENGVVQRWDLRMPSVALLNINAHEKACYTIDWHPDGRHLVSGGFDKYVKIWDFKSENRRQKPAFQLRAPQAILNIKWRPPSWSSDLTKAGHWQNAQLATSYVDDDPRIHIWDLRRPFLPFRELDRHDSRPSDMLWASQDLLWTVGSQGMFTQVDVRHTALVHDELSTSAIDFLPDGSFAAFSEDTFMSRESTIDDPAADFLRISQERLSGETDGPISRSISDDDADDGLLTPSSRRRYSKSSRSAKSQGNTPPIGDGFLHAIPLDKAALHRNGFFNNEQSGIISSIAGIAAEPEVVEFLADNYAQPMTVEERKNTPSKILSRLEEAFQQNAKACDYVSMHRTAQSWRILGAVVISELREWADSKRRERLADEVKRKVSQPLTRQTKSTSVLSLLPKQPAHGSDSQPLVKPGKAMSNLFKGVVESEAHRSEAESTSNMTTPMARPLPDSPSMDNQRHENSIPALNEAIEPIPLLPPSLVTSHSTAAAASNALLSVTSQDSPPSSPEQSRRPVSSYRHHKRSVTDTLITSTDNGTQRQSPGAHTGNKSVSSPMVQPSPRMEFRTQEDRRAALKDFRAQQRQPFTLEESYKSPQQRANSRHDSSESFPMFSVSTDGSHRTKALGISFDSERGQSYGARGSEEWQDSRAGELTDSSLPSSSSDPSGRGLHAIDRFDFEDGSMQDTFPMDDAPRATFGPDVATQPKPKAVRSKASASASMWDMNELRSNESNIQSSTAASSASGGEMFHFEQAHAVSKLKIYSSNPIRKIVAKVDPQVLNETKQQTTLTKDEDTKTKEYVYSDFRAIDFTTYEPTLPFAWSALPLLCHSIEFDILEGIACAQFSVQLLMHLHPFFFPGVRVQVQPGIAPPDSIAERLMRPDLCHRVIGGLFLNHLLYLKKMGLYTAMAELRNICVDFDYPEIIRPAEQGQSVGAGLKQDPFQLQTTCSSCTNYLPSGTIVCSNCYQPKNGCPICLQLRSPTQTQQQHQPLKTLTDSYLWTFCHTCGHSAHQSCMQQWQLQPDAEGECPTLGCGCDCGPGLLRQHRIARQIKDTENTEMIRGSAPRSGFNVAKRDPVRASPSPAVDKTRDALMRSVAADSSSVGVRDGSGDEYSRRGLGGRSRGGGGSTSARANNHHHNSSTLGDTRRNSSTTTTMSSTGGTATGTGTGTGTGGDSRPSGQSFGRRVRLVTPGEEISPQSTTS